MKNKFLLILIIFQFFIMMNLYSDETNDLSDDIYGWIKNEKIKENIIKSEKIRRETKSRMFFSGEVFLFLLYHPSIWQGESNDKAGDYAYQKMDFTKSKYYSDNKGGYKSSSWGAMDTGFYGNFKISAPFIDSDMGIFEGNNMSLSLNWSFNWIQADIGFTYTFQPFPFYYSSLGINIGSGWEFLWESSGSPILFGMGLNTKDSREPQSTPLLGPVLSLSFLNCLQMDVSAFIPKKSKRWTHLIFTASAEFYYQALLTVNENQLYRYKNDNNLLNGWQFNSEFVFGYLIPVIEDNPREFKSFRRLVHRNFSIMPLFISKIQVPLSHFNDSRMKNHGWGSDFVNVYLMPCLKFGLPDNFSFLILSEFATAKRYTEETIANQYLKDKEYEDWYFYFSKIGFVLGWSF